jgi:hypothetical protein
MWQCGKCREKVEDNFDVCWNCGTSKEGVVDPGFQREDTGEDMVVRRGPTGDRADTAAPQVMAPATAGAGPAVPSTETQRFEADHPVAHVLVTVFRVSAGIVALLYLILFFMTVDAASRVGMSVGVPVGIALVRVLLEAVLAVSLLLAVGEFLRLGMALERNTRSRSGFGEKRKPR